MNITDINSQLEEVYIEKPEFYSSFSPATHGFCRMEHCLC